MAPIFLKASTTASIAMLITLIHGKRINQFSHLPSSPFTYTSSDTFFKCMKLQKPPFEHVLISCWRQRASRKSETGDNSAYIGFPLNLIIYKSLSCDSMKRNHRLSNSWHAFSASSSFTNFTYKLPT
jgi:hypothetical protein